MAQNTWNGIKLLSQSLSVFYRSEVTVQDVILLVSYIGRTVIRSHCGRSTQCLDLFSCRFPAKGEHLHGNGTPLAQSLHELGIVYNHNKALTCHGDDFFSQECASKSLYKIQLRIHFVCTIHTKVKERLRLQGGEWNIQRTGKLFRVL